MGLLHSCFNKTKIAYPHKENVSSGLPTQNCVKQSFGEAPKFTPDVGILPVLRPPVEPCLHHVLLALPNRDPPGQHCTFIDYHRLNLKLRPQGCTDLQSLITCLGHGDTVAKYAVMQVRVRLRNALKCISEAIFTVMVSNTAGLKLRL